MAGYAQAIIIGHLVQRHRAIGEANHRWKGSAATDDAKRRRALLVYKKLGACNRCGEQATQRHHINRNIEDNTPENIEPLCFECHLKEHPRTRPHSTVCSNCQRSVKDYTDKGRCSACVAYIRANGVERPESLYRRTLPSDSSYTIPTCINCGKLPGMRPSGTRKSLSKGRCDACWLYFHNHGVDRPKEGLRRRVF